MAGIMSKLRERGFCPYCGCVIRPDARACHAHSDLPKLDPPHTTPAVKARPAK